jgi:superfamily I DNA and/or RNA helicase
LLNKKWNIAKILFLVGLCHLYKVAETIQPEQEMYDYVIIDEASQLGPDAIFLLYITKNIIIVGDDKQTSPEYVGVDANTMTPHIKASSKWNPFFRLLRNRV